MSGFQSHVNLYPAPGSPGQRASMNPVATVAAGPGGLVAGTNGCYAGRFAWNSYATAGGPGVANYYSPTAPAKPDGFVANEMQGLITTWLAESSLLIPEGLPVTEYYMGDFWAVSNYSEAVIGNKVFANLFSGEVLPAATGAFPVNVAGVAAAFTATITPSSYTMTVSAVASGTLAVGQLVTATGLPPKTYIESLGTGTGSTGTYYLSQAPVATITAGSFTAAVPGGVGGGTMTASATISGASMNITGVTSGVVAAGMYASGTGVPSGTYVSALNTSTGGTGLITLSAAVTATISGGTILFSPWIETDWYVKSAGNVGDLIKIGIKSV